MISEDMAWAKTIIGRQHPNLEFRTDEAPRKVMLSVKFIARGLMAVLQDCSLEQYWGQLWPWQRHELIASYKGLLAAAHLVHASSGQPPLEFSVIHHAGVKQLLVSICRVVTEITSRLSETGDPMIADEHVRLLTRKILHALAVLEPLLDRSTEAASGAAQIDLRNGLEDMKMYFG